MSEQGKPKQVGTGHSAAGGRTVPGGAISGEAVSGEAMPAETMPAETMPAETMPAETMITVSSSRFGELHVPASSVIEVPSGLIGFPKATHFIMIDHKPPFSWLHSTQDPNLAFVVVDGFAFGQQFEAPFGDKDIDLKPQDEFAILVVVTVRSDPRMTTANLKAPVFVNVRNRRGVQIIFDNPAFSTRHPLWTEEATKQEKADAAEAKGPAESEVKKEGDK
jgi:flagellar assembly factor FliW